MRRFVLTIIAACLLCGCGANNTFSPTVGVNPCSVPVIASKLFGKTWIGQFDCGGTTRILRLVFAQSGCNVTVSGQGLIYNGATFPSFPAIGIGTFDQNTGAFIPVDAPVTITGNQATFSPSFIVYNPTNNQTIVPPGPILVVPGTTFTATVTVIIADATLTGSYSTQRADAAHQQGNICFAPETVPTANVAGHWTGTMTGTTNQSVGPGTLDVTLAMNGNAVSLASQGTLTTSEVTVRLNAPTGISGIVIGNQVLLGATFTRPSAGQQDQLQHRWLVGTINGNTITGEFSDIVNPTGTGTFTLTR
jgi:hypothetical protein